MHDVESRVHHAQAIKNPLPEASFEVQWLKLLHRHLLWVLVQILAAPLPVELLADYLGKAVDDLHSAWAPAATWATRKNQLAQH